MSSTTAARLMSADEFFDFVHRPENRDRCFELESGELIESSRPGERHGLVCANVVFELSVHVRRRGQGYVCSNDTGLILEHDPDTVRGPDVVLYTQSMQYDQLNRKYSEQPPTLAVEVLSPNASFGRVTRRVSQLLRHGVGMVWLVEPEARTVTVYRDGAVPVVFDDSEELAVEDLLPGFRCKVADLFHLPGAPASPTAG